MLQPAESHKPFPLPANPVCAHPARRFLLLFFTTFFLAESLSVLFVPAQAPDDDVVRVSTDLLLFPVRIRDKSGNAVPGLTERDLSLKDDDHATTALHFTPGGERIALVFALDQSGSLRQIISQQRDAALALFSRFGERSRVAIIRFAETPKVVAAFGRDTDTARAAFDFSVNNQHTAIFDAASLAVQTLNELRGDRAERRIVILISDGLDNASTSKPSKVIDDAIHKNVSFYVIHLPLFEPRDGHLAVRQPTKGFRDLAEKTGGKYFLVGDVKSALSPSKINDLNPIFRAIEEDLKSQYLLGFYIAESARNGQRHRFSVTLRSRDLEYSVGKLGYSNTHQFFVDMRPGNLNNIAK